MKGARKQMILGVNLKKDKIDGTDLYKNKHGLPIDIRKVILPIYNALTKPEAEEMFAWKNPKCKRVVQ